MTKLSSKTELTYSDQKSDVAGHFPTAEAAQEYAEKVASAQYHLDRIRALKTLVGAMGESSKRTKTVMDFGVGDGGVLKSLGFQFDVIHGIDVSEPMIQIADRTLSDITNKFIGHVGSVEALTAVPSASIDLTLCINTLGYLTPDEQSSMFAEFARVTKVGGQLLVMVGNELFDMFALNGHTATFFNKYLTQADVRPLMTHSMDEVWKVADRRNPLSFRFELGRFHFTERAQSFAGWHSQPPPIALQAAGGDFIKARSIMRDPSVDPNAAPPSEQWKNNFVCSNFCSLSVREQ